jgi:hypothetical protein
VHARHWQVLPLPVPVAVLQALNSELELGALLATPGPSLGQHALLEPQRAQDFVWASCDLLRPMRE